MRDRFVGVCMIAALVIPGSARPARCETPESVPELNLVEDLVYGASGSTTGDGLFGTIAGAAVDSRGFLHILDSGFGCLWKYSVGGQLQLRYGSEGEGPGEFRNPRVIAIGPDDRVLVGGDSPLITIFDADGAPLALHRRDPATMAEPARALVVDDQGRVLVSSVDVDEHRVIFQYDPADFSLVRSFGDSYAAGHDVDPRAERAFGGGALALGPAGDELLFVQSAPPLVRIHGLDGELRATFAIRGSDNGLPRAEIDGDRFAVFSPDMTAMSILGQDDGSILVAIAEPDPDDGRRRRTWQGTVHLDQYDRAGRLLRSTARDRLVRPLCRDARGRVYIAEHREIDGYECPVVVRYRME